MNIRLPTIRKGKSWIASLHLQFALREFFNKTPNQTFHLCLPSKENIMVLEIKLRKEPKDKVEWIADEWS